MRPGELCALTSLQPGPTPATARTAPPRKHSTRVQFSGGVASLDAVDAVARLAQQKAAALAELRTMTAEAEARRRAGEAGDFEEEFQNRFAQKVLEVRR